LRIPYYWISLTCRAAQKYPHGKRGERIFIFFEELRGWFSPSAVLDAAPDDNSSIIVELACLVGLDYIRL